MPEEKITMFANRLKKVYRHISKQAKRLGVTCYRVYDQDLPEFPFCIEVYEDKLYIAEYDRRHRMSEEHHEEWLRESLNVMRDVFEIDTENIFLRLRRRKPGKLGQYRKENAAQREFVVRENGLKFLVNLSDYLDTGLFLDHRLTREKVKVEAKDKKVLNLFCYTGSFSVYAASGGASEVVSVDISKTYLNWASRNFELNGFSPNPPSGPPVPVRTGDGGKYLFNHADVKQYLKSIPPNHFDLVILDPPTFSNSQRMSDFLDVQRDHVQLINDCLGGMSESGVLYFSTNYTKFVLDVEKINSDSVKDITKQTTPFDFEGKLRRYCFRIAK
jgi:23S rRNA (cytosine1962-C5)-methyltransferase